MIKRDLVVYFILTLDVLAGRFIFIFSTDLLTVFSMPRLCIDSNATLKNTISNDLMTRNAFLISRLVLLGELL